MKRSDLMMIVTAVAIGAATLVTAPATAQDGLQRGAMTFEQLDADGDGQLTSADFAELRSQRFAQLDADADGSVSRDEFAAAAAGRASDRAAAMFDRLDADGDGALGRDVLDRGRGDAGPRLLSRLDTDGDGAVSREEYDAGRERMAQMRDNRKGDGRGDRHGNGHRHQ